MGHETQDAAQIEALLGFREGTAKDQVLDVLGLHAAIGHQLRDHLRGNVVRPGLGQRALGGEMKRRAAEMSDDCVWHEIIISDLLVASGFLLE